MLVFSLRTNVLFLDPAVASVSHSFGFTNYLRLGKIPEANKERDPTATENVT